ncbi:hypothetical protein [Brevibacillus sp. NRS-1366]|uniref:hypothetical protein n=1 Tax=Brevibacillus sp. NRS-1366 TaxID=3233899 RepID=UPI003D24BB83
MAIDVYRNHKPYLPEDGTISDRLLHYAFTDWSLGRDQFGSIYTVLYNGDAIIIALATEFVGTAVEGIIVGMNMGTRGAKITKKVDTIVNSAGKLSKSVIDHATKKHDFTKFKNQIPYLLNKNSRETVEKIIAKQTFFNKDWTSEMIEDAVQKAYEVALKNGVKNDTVTIEYLGEKVTLGMRDGLPQTSFGDHVYTLLDFGF